MVGSRPLHFLLAETAFNLQGRSWTLSSLIGTELQFWVVPPGEALTQLCMCWYRSRGVLRCPADVAPGQSGVSGETCVINGRRRHLGRPATANKRTEAPQLQKRQLCCDGVAIRIPQVELRLMVAARLLQENATRPGPEEAHAPTRPSASQVGLGWRLSSCLWACMSVCHAVGCMLCFSCVSRVANGLWQR